MTLTFGALCSYLQSVENISIRQPRLPPKKERESIREITKNWFTNQRHNLDHAGMSGSAVLSALFPHLRKDRVYGLQSALLAKKLTRILNLGHAQQNLFNDWKSGKFGDLGAYTERAMSSWDGTFSTKHILPITQIDQLLTQLAAKYRFSDESVRRQRNPNVEIDVELKEILIRIESWEAKWLVRLILRDHCTINLDEEHILAQYHFLLPDLLQFQNDFEAVFAMLRGELRLYPASPHTSEEQRLRVEASQKLRPIVGIKVGRPKFHKAWSFKHCGQLVGKRAWAAEVKYDGEYCEIHIDLDNAPNEIKIFSKNGKDATADREPLHATIRTALRMGHPDCLIKSNCIILGEMVLYSDEEKQIMPFSKIRKHISRSGSFIGTWQDSLPHEWEHLMIVFFDVLILNNQPILRHCLQDRRKVLKDLVNSVTGRSMRAEWSLLDFKTGDGITDLKQAFARNLANRQEGLVLKPLHSPYFPLLTDQGLRQASFFVKVKRDYLADMGGERDLGDFAIIGASFDAQVAPKSDLKPLHWTHFHLGCCTNKAAVQRQRAKPKFKVVAALTLDKCIPKADVKYLNIQGYVRQALLRDDGTIDAFDIEHLQPFVAEILGGGFEKLQNENFEMLRHPRVKKLHGDRTWKDCATMEDLARMAEEKWDLPDADKLDGHAKDVALLVKQYRTEMGESQTTVTTDKTTQHTTPHTTQETAMTITPLPPPRFELLEALASDGTVQESQEQQVLSSPLSSTQHSYTGSTQGNGISASRSLHILVREDTSERLARLTTTTATSSSSSQITDFSPIPVTTSGMLHAPASTADAAMIVSTSKKSRSLTHFISPPTAKRQRILSPLQSSRSNRTLGAFECDSQEDMIHVYAKAGVRVQVHSGRGVEGTR
ncbi:hypothetical protein DE146DRAFT_761920 [Phaeosphaeria sp. MPI-PUGE-AT-0046c]|nr:hypothetical protein DE146DRAFT_761920 [Phaeosphaeria sp. MPI-PUGE-AT-0046c]